MTRTTVFAVVALTVIVAVGVVATQFASDDPDGLEFVAEQEGFSDTAEEHTLEDTALADYGSGSGLNPAVAAMIGVVAVGALTLGLFRLARRPDEPDHASQGT